MEEKVYHLIEKMYREIQKGFERVDEKLDQKAGNSDIARMEHDHGEKLAALFDLKKTQEAVNCQVLSALERIEEKLDTHDTQIFSLQYKNR